MPTPIKMPALSPTMEEGTLAKWLVKEGDQVSAGDIMAEIETDKATMEFEAVDEGTIVAIDVPEGTEGVKVGTVIATLAGEDEDPEETRPPPAAMPRAKTRTKAKARMPRRPIRPPAQTATRRRPAAMAAMALPRPPGAIRPRPRPCPAPMASG